MQWQHVEQTSKASIQEKKIRVSFLPASGSLTTPSHNNVNGTVRVYGLCSLPATNHGLLASESRPCAKLRSSCVQFSIARNIYARSWQQWPCTCRCRFEG